MQLFRLTAVLNLTGLSRSTLYAAIRRGEFPPPVKIGARAVAWRSDDIENWLKSRPLAR